MHDITASFASRKPISADSRSPKNKRKFNAPLKALTNQPNSGLKDVQPQDNYCFYCRIKGYVRADRKLKDQIQSPTATKKSTSSVIEETSPSAMSSSSTVATVSL